jgi:hypothetical protein
MDEIEELERISMVALLIEDVREFARIQRKIALIDSEVNAIFKEIRIAIIQRAYN